jgi:hypothetical protein
MEPQGPTFLFTMMLPKCEFVLFLKACELANGHRVHWVGIESWGSELTVLVPQNAWWVVTLVCHSRNVRPLSLQMQPHAQFGLWVVGVFGQTHPLEEVLHLSEIGVAFVDLDDDRKEKSSLGCLPIITSNDTTPKL